jgi:uncharacterized membrane protein YfcA
LTAIKAATVNAELWVLAGGAAVAGFVQGISGFAFGMVAMSLWVWTIDPRVAAVMSVLGGLTGQLLSAITVRRGLHLGLLWPFVAGAGVGVPLGVLLLPLLDPAWFKGLLGLILLVFCPPMLWADRLPRITHGGRLGDAAAGAVGGVMGAVGGFTGVAPALWCTLRGYNRDEHRAVLQNFNLAALTATAVALGWSGAITAEVLPRYAVVAPALVLPSMLGARVYLGLSAAQFRRVVLVVLSASGVVMLGSALHAALG